MKFFVAFTALVALTAAGPLKPQTSFDSDLQAIIAAIQSPSTDPATAIALEQHLQDLLGGISVGPAIIGGSEPVSIEPVLVDFPIPESALVDTPQYEPISIEPALVDFPIPESALLPTPITIGSADSPLVQIIVNVKQSAPAVDAAALPVEIPITHPVNVVDVAENHEVIEPTPVQVVEVAPVEVEPVIIGTPSLVPTPVINIPGILN